MNPTVEFPLRILHIVGGMNRGGVETWLLRVLRGLDRERFRMDFLVHTGDPCAYDEEARRLGSRIIPCLHPRRPLAYARRFRRIAAAHGPYDVVHSHVYLFSGFTLRLAARAGVGVRIAHIYPQVDYRRPGPLRSAYRRLMTAGLKRWATHLLACSHQTLEAFAALCDCSALPTEVIYPGIDLRPFRTAVDRQLVRHNLSLPADRPLIVYVARFAPHKNHLQMLRVADTLKERGFNGHFALIGSHGELLPRLREMVSRRENCSLLTSVRDISAVLQASDLFFFPSLNEGFGIVALEAAAAGLPVVAADLPALREACPPGHRRFMFPPDDDRTAAARIVRITGDEQLREQLAAEARSWAARFSIEQSTRRLADLYASAADTARPAAGPGLRR